MAQELESVDVPITIENEYLIGATRDTVLVGSPVMGYMSPAQALRLAAWLVVVAEPLARFKFDTVLQQVRES